jgi:hypothetical protein
VSSAPIKALLLKDYLLLFISLSTQTGKFSIHPRKSICVCARVCVCTSVLICVAQPPDDGDTEDGKR